MSHMTISALKLGEVFGDHETEEYVYMPDGEIGSADPMFVYETSGCRRDVNIAEALRLIRVRSLRPVKHPRLPD